MNKLSRPILISAIAHLVIVGVLAFNFSFHEISPQQNISAAPKIMAQAVKAEDVKKYFDDKASEKKRIADAEKRRQQKKRQQAEAAKKKKQEDERKKREAEKKRQDAIKKKKEEEQRKKDEAAQKKREEEAKQKRLEEEKQRKAEEERQRKAEAERKRQEELEKQMAAQMEAEMAELNEAKRQAILSEVDVVKSRIMSKIRRNWIRPEHKAYCRLRIELAPSGLVLAVTEIEGDPVYCRTGKSAVFKSDPLPMSKDADVAAEFRSFTIKLQPEEDE